MREDRRPLPLQLREEILAIIEGEGLQPGDRLPTEIAIADRFGVGRTTAREALKLLEQDGIIDVRHGSGRFVSQVATLERPITRLESVTEMMRAHGYSVTNRVVSAASRAASAEERTTLGLLEDEIVMELERVRLHVDEPLIYSVDVFRRSLVADPIEDSALSGSLLDLLEANGTLITSAMAQLHAVHLPEAGQRAIGHRTSEPWVLLTHRNLDETGATIIVSQDYYRGDRFTFNVFRRRG